MVPTIQISDPVIRDRLRSKGYCYLNDDLRMVQHPPEVGWYLSTKPDGISAIRLTDTPFDPVVEDDVAHVRTDMESLGDPR